MRRILTILLACIVICSLAITAYAHDVPQDIPGSIKVLVKYDGQPVSGGKLTCIKVGEVYEEDGNYSFVRVIDGIPLENVQSHELAEELAEFYENNKDNYEFDVLSLSVDADGIAKFQNRSIGLYLIIQSKAADGYSKLKPFLVSLPYMENGVYRYDVTAAIKSELEKETETVPPTSTPEPVLPQTGQLNWPVPLMAVLGLGLFVLGCRLCKKKESYEK